jgi:hypothetical protein
MKNTLRRPAGMGMIRALMILLALPIAAFGQTNVHVTTEQPFQFTIRSKGWQNTTLGSSYIRFSGSEIPDGKMLVVEQFSAQVAVNPGERAAVTVGCTGVKGVKPANHHPAVISQGIFGGARGGIELLSVSLPLRCYTVSGDSGMYITLRRNSQFPVPNDNAAESQVSISGFLQNLP